jgi:hypothetical protein
MFVTGSGSRSFQHSSSGCTHLYGVISRASLSLIVHRRGVAALARPAFQRRLDRNPKETSLVSRISKASGVPPDAREGRNLWTARCCGSSVLALLASQRRAIVQLPREEVCVRHGARATRTDRAQIVGDIGR